MSVVVSDTSPINYLVLIGRIELLEKLYGRVIIPPAVLSELQQAAAPEAVRNWVASNPAWLESRSIVTQPDVTLIHLDPGEQEAITLAKEIRADALIIDEVKGREAAVNQGIAVIGTLRILFDATGIGLCDLPTAFSELQQTSFRAAPKLFQYFLALDAARQQAP